MSQDAQPDAFELITLPQTPDAATLAQLLHTEGGAALSIQRGQDAHGQPRLVLEVRHPDPEVVAQTRQNIIRACMRLKLRAFVI